MTPAQPSLSNFYRWEVPGKKVSVHLDFSVVDRLLVEVMRGFGAIPRRGAEVGGILVGSAEVTDHQIVVHITDIEPVNCEHRRGPSYLLSEGDSARFAAAYEKHRFSPVKSAYAIGMYRSHTREGMALAAEDLALFDQYVPEASAVFLLIKPYATRVSTAGFFIRESDGTVHSESSYQEFPFRRKELGGGAMPDRPREQHAPHAAEDATPNRGAFRGHGPPSYSDEAPQAYAEAPEDYPPGTSAEDLSVTLSSVQPPEHANEHDSAVAKFRRTNVWIPLSFIFLLLGVLIGFQAAIAYRPAKAAGILNDAYTLSLAASRTGDNLHVRWDRNSHAVRTAQRGVLTITDGTYSTTVDLDVAQLQNPSVFYRNMSTTVKFRLEIFTKERNTVSETLEWSK
ncbi:MAG: hypothetical protein SFV51_10755 [Bryobacteraceae bacterium]|nr:hypothetical protein [Bryobacteraceae bacterium]